MYYTEKNEKNLSHLVQEICSTDNSIIASFITGSFVNGYFKEDSDIDIVLVSEESKPIQNLKEKVSIHYIDGKHLNYFEKAKFYCILRNIPLYNQEYVEDLSLRMKKKMVIMESKRLQKLNKKESKNNQIVFTPWDIISKYFIRQWGIIEPWRIKPLNRLLNSSQSKEILEGEYNSIFEGLVNDNFLTKENKGYAISKNVVLNEDENRISSPIEELRWFFNKSYGGLLYLTNMPEILKNIKTIYGYQRG